jgi:colanic acid/amylovoran biosynthesis protein
VLNTVALNGGDAAILLALLDRLRDAFGPDTELAVADSHAETARRIYPSIDFRPWLWRHVERGARAGPRGRLVREARKLRLYAGAWCLGRGWESVPRLWLRTEELRALADYARADLVVSTGGTYLMEQYWLKPRIFELTVPLLLRRPLVLFTQSLGPIRRRGQRAALRRILRRSELVLLRDRRSLEHLRDLRVPELRVRLSPDAAFAMPAGEGRHAPPRSGSRCRVAVSVRHWPYFSSRDRAAADRRYRLALAAAVQHLVQRVRAEVTLLSTCQGIPEYWTDDSAVAAEIAELLPEDVRGCVHVDGSFHTPGELAELLRGFDAVIATRMHMAILALQAGVPVLAIAYEFKTRELFAELGLGEWVQDIEEVDADVLPRAVDALLREAPALRKRIGPSVDQRRAEAEGASELIRAAFDGRLEGKP